METTARKVKVSTNYDMVAWKWMRYSAILLIPLAWGHIILQDVIVGVHQIDLAYINGRWGDSLLNFWRVYDFFLLAFAFAHGVNGLRQVLRDYVKSESAMRVISWVLLLGWLVITFLGAAAIVMGVSLAS